MIPLYTKEAFDRAKDSDKLPLQCKQCSNTFNINKKRIKDALNPNKTDKGNYCSIKCNGFSQRNDIATICTECGIKVYKRLNQFKKFKNSFCSRSCNVSYNNKHKNYGIRRSKIEVWLEEQLTQLYPSFNIQFNKPDAIGSELDIYVPELKKAIEINGIFHYEPIYGEEKWKQIQANDKKKVIACEELNIELMVVDIRIMKHFKPKRAKPYLDLIVQFIDQP